MCWKKKLSLFWRGWGGSFLIMMIIIFSFRSAIADWNDVPTGSMKPTILEGDRIFVNKLAYNLKVPFTTWHLAHWGDPKKGDIVVFFSPLDGMRLVKRVIGLPGESVAIQNNQLFINGNAVPYEPAYQEMVDQLPRDQQSYHLLFIENIGGKKHPVMFRSSRSFSGTFGPVIVPPGCYFMMGDNRDNSLDSRFFGFVERRQIVGQAVGVVLSLNRDNHYLPRWHRSFMRLP